MRFFQSLLFLYLFYFVRLCFFIVSLCFFVVSLLFLYSFFIVSFIFTFSHGVGEGYDELSSLVYNFCASMARSDVIGEWNIIRLRIIRISANQCSLRNQLDFAQRPPWQLEDWTWPNIVVESWIKPGPLL